MVLLNWQDGNTEEEYFSIERMSETSGIFEELSLAGVDTTFYDDTDWSYSGHLYYRVRAGASGAYSDYSNTVEIIMPDFEPFSIMLGGSGDDRNNNLSMTSCSGFITCGYTTSSDGNIAFNHGGGGDMLFAKLNYLGEAEWISSMGGAGMDAASMILETDGYNIWTKYVYKFRIWVSKRRRQ